MPTTRDMAAADMPQVRNLLEQLDYILEQTDVERRFRPVVGAPDHSLIVAKQDGHVTGFNHLYARPVSTITLFDGSLIAAFDGLPASASRVL